MEKEDSRQVEKTTFMVLFAISLAHMLNDAVQSVVPSIYPIIKDDFGLSFAQIGIVTLVFQMTSSILQPFVGRYADKHPSPYALTLGMCFTLCGLLLLAFSNNFMMIIFSVSVIGMGSSIFHPEASRVAQLAAGRKKGLAQSIFQVGGNGGGAIGPLLAAIIVLPHGQRSIVWFSIAAVVGGIVVTRVGKWYSHKIATNMTKELKKSRSLLALTPRQINRAMLVLVILTFSKQFYLASMTSYFTFFLIDKFGMSIQNSQLCLFAFLAASAVGMIAGGVSGDQ